MMVQYVKVLVICAVCLSSCVHEYKPDSVEYFRLEANIEFDDIEYWPDNQSIWIGCFEEEDARQPIASTELNGDSESITVAIEDIAEGSYFLKIFITEGGVYKSDIYNYGSIAINASVFYELQNIQLLTYQRVQQQVFNGCQLCHGGSSGDIAAGLYLTEENSYQSLVNVLATKNTSLLRVKPGSAEFSYLIDVIDETIDFDHGASNSVTEADRQLVVDWIEAGALNN